ncbi:MAG: glycosyltransferase family 2 protein [Deltaproteobacteria bacterium]|nr:glycosyltransferase family 2 protein [Deltaproteobacteria bacterium]
MNDMSTYLSIVIPLYNEEESVEKLLASILRVSEQFDFPYEIIFVDDGSQDNTWAIIEQLKEATPQLRAIKFRRNYGQTSAMVAGFDYACGEVIVTMDGDLQNDPSDISMLLEKIKEGYDIVSGWRKDRKDHVFRVFPSKVANAIISFSTRVRLHDYGCSLKAYRAECIKSLHAYGEMHRFFPALASMTGARVTEVPVKHHPRRYGVSKYGFDRILKVLSDIFAMNLIIRFSSNPLKGFVLCAAPFLLVTLFFGGLGILALMLDWASGKSLFFIIASALTGMAVVHLVTLGVLGELVVGMSDLEHTSLPEITKKCIVAHSEEDKNQEASGQKELSAKGIAHSA